MITFPNAKINLGLNIVSKRPDGYHNLETIFYPIPLRDSLEIGVLDSSHNKSYKFHQSGIKLEGDASTNLVVKAYNLLKEEYKLPPIEIYLHKNIPTGAGLGGGSADAAFMLKLLNDKFSLNLSTSQLENYAATLGADCAFFIQNKPTFAEGIGTKFTPIDLDLKGYDLFLIKPDLFISTQMAFAKIKPQPAKHSPYKLASLPLEEWRTKLTNDFEDSLFPELPQLAEIKDYLYNNGAIYASLSGSGSTVYGIFKDCTLKTNNRKGHYLLEL